MGDRRIVFRFLAKEINFFSVFVIKFKPSLGTTQNIIEGVDGVIRVV
jgi:hypothetical protein